jgi:hypothetical protein
VAEVAVVVRAVDLEVREVRVWEVWEALQCSVAQKHIQDSVGVRQQASRVPW